MTMAMNEKRVATARKPNLTGHLRSSPSNARRVSDVIGKLETMLRMGTLEGFLVLSDSLSMGREYTREEEKSKRGGQIMNAW